MKSTSPLQPFFVLFVLIGSAAFAQVAVAQEAPANTVSKAEPKLEFSFEGEEWKTVLEWVAEEANLTLIVDTLPPGKFNFSDKRSYTPTQAIDIINSWLVARDFVLVENNSQLVLLNLANEIPPNLVREAGPEDLDSMGNYEFARCTFAPKTLPIEQVKEEFTALLEDSFGKMYVLPNTRRLVVTDMVSNLRTLKRVLGDLETSTIRGGVQAAILPLKNITPDDAMLTVRQIYQIPEEVFSTQDGELRFSVDPTGRQLILRAKPDKIAAVKELLALIDVPLEGVDEVEEEVEPIFAAYETGLSEPTIVLKVMQTMFAGQPEVRLDVGEESGQLFMLATPDDHKLAQRYLEGMQSKADSIEVFPLNILDADLAKTRIEALVGTTTTDEEGVETMVGPRIIADATRRQLIVRGSGADMQMIRAFLSKSGEVTDGSGGSSAASQNLRVIPMDGVVTKAVLDRAMEIWPTMRANPIKIVLPDEPDDAIQTKTPTFEDLKEMEKLLSPENGEGESDKGGADQSDESVKVSQIIVPVTYLAQVVPAETTAAETTAAETNSESAAANDEAAVLEKVVPADGKPPAKVVVTPGVGGIIISSDDTAALDEFEELLRLLSDPYLFPASDTVIFPLKYAKAEQAKALLDKLLGNSSDSGGGLGDMMGGMMGGLMGGGMDMLGGLLGDSSTVGPVTITTDSRLNLLFVQADPIDVARVEQLIKVIDKEESPIKVETRPEPRVIPLKRANATELAATLKEAFPPQSGGGGGGGGNEQIQKLIQQIGGGGRGGGGRGGGGGGQGGGGGDTGPEIAIAADARSNTLVVVAPDQIFQEIEKLALFLDESATESNEVTKIVPLTRANPETIQRALTALYGAQVGAAASANPAGQGSTQGGRPSSGGGSGMSPEAMKAIQQRIQQFRDAAGRGGGDRGGRGGGDRGGRGGGDRGGRGGGR